MSATSLPGLEAWFALRDRWLASARFRRLAAALPFLRPIARLRARALFDLCAGFAYSQVLAACVRLDLFRILADGPQSIGSLAPRLGLGLEPATRLLRAAVALRLAARHGADRYGLGALGAPLVGNDAVCAMVEHHALLYADLADPVALLRGDSPATALSDYWCYGAAGSAVSPGEDRARGYTALMAASQPLVADEILAAHSFRRNSSLLDVGGGDGTFLAAVGQRYPDLRLMLFDLPAVAQRARERFAAQRLAARATVHEGSFLVDSLPPGADAASLVRVLHDHDDPDAMRILRKVHDVLPEGGRLVVAEPLAQAPGAPRVGDAYFGFYLLAMGRGRPRTAAEHLGMLRAAGFRSARQVATRIPLQTGVLVAIR